MTKIESVVTDATIVSVGTRQVGARNSTLWEVTTQDGTKWVTFKAQVGNAATNNQGAVVDMSVSIEQNGDFTNYYVNDIRVKAPAAQPQGLTVPASEIQTLAARAQEAATAKQEMGFAEFAAHEQRKNESIHRQVAAKVACQLASEDADEFWSNVSALFDYFQTGRTPFTQTPSEVKQNPYPLPSHAGTPDPGYQHTDADVPPPDDIPF
jgi:hypothetical protein